jgi:hypothetical protein
MYNSGVTYFERLPVTKAELITICNFAEEMGKNGKEVVFYDVGIPTRTCECCGQSVPDGIIIEMKVNHGIATATKVLQS